MISNLTYLRPHLVALFLLVVVAAGLSALFALGRQEDPTITNLFATITTEMPGADPARVEALVTVPLEERLREFSEVDVVQSRSATNVSVIGVELGDRLSEVEIDQAWSELRDAVADVARTLPDDALAPDFSTDETGAYGVIVALTPRSDMVPMTIVARQAEWLAERLRDVDGTDLVRLYGAPREEILVRLDASRLAALGLGVGDVARRVAQADADMSAGRMRGPQTEAVLRLTGAFADLDRLRTLAILRNGASTLRLGDIAEITRGPERPRAETAAVDGRPAVLVAAKIAEGQQVDAWMVDIRSALAAARPTLTEDVALRIVFDQSRYTIDRLTEVLVNMGIGVALVVGVLLLTLGLRPSLIVAAVLPVVSLATLATMQVLGLAIHQMSVTGLIVALGLLVDAAIVMTDEVSKRIDKGLDRAEAVGDAVRRLFAPLLASTVTTALAFMPMILLPGPAGDFVGSIAIAVVVMLGWSFVVAMVVTPALAGWSLHPRPRRRDGWAVRAWRGLIGLAIAHPVRSIALGLVLPITGFTALPLLTSQFFPGVDRDQFHLEIELPPSASEARTRAVADSIAERIALDPDVVRTVRVTGRSAPAFYYNMVTDRRSAPEFAQLLVTTGSPAATERLVAAFQRDLPAAFPEAEILVRALVQGPPVAAPVEFRVVGPDLDRLSGLGQQIRSELAAMPQVTVARASLEPGAPGLQLSTDEPKLRSLGLDPAAVAVQLAAATDGVLAGTVLEGTEEIPVRLRMGGAWRDSADRLQDLPLALPGDRAFAQLPLSAVANAALAPQPPAVTRRNGERVNIVQAFLAHGVLPEEALTLARERLEAAGFVLPAGYRLELGGDADARAETLANLLSTMPMVVVLSIAAVVLSFGDWRLSGITFAVAGLSGGLSLLALAAFTFPFGINAIIGVIGSIGVSINAAIIILSGLQQDTRAFAGDRAAMADVVVGSSRHILSTTVTTFGGFLPLILEGGGFWPPFAMSIAGGVLLSTIVSFFVVPPAFALAGWRRTDRADPVRARETSQSCPPALDVAAE